MSFPAIIVLKDASNANENFLRLHADASKVTYALETATLAEPVTLVIGKQMTESSKGSNRHMAKLTSVVNDVSGNPFVLTSTFTMTVPKQVIAQTDVDDHVARQKSFLTPENVAKMERGEL